MRPLPVVLGTAALAGLQRPCDPAEAIRTLRAAQAAGIARVDTAPFYGLGTAERLVGEALSADGSGAGVAVSTKAGRLIEADPTAAPHPDWPGAPRARIRLDYSYDGVMRSFDESCRRLGCEQFDLLFLHDLGRKALGDAAGPHFRTAMTGGLRALDALRDGGRIRGYGLGVNEVEVCLEALPEARWDCFLLAGRLTLLDHRGAGPLLQACTAHGVSLLVGGVFNSGLLAGERRFDYAEPGPATLGALARLEALCGRWGVPLTAAAVQFPLRFDAVEAVLCGARTAREVDGFLHLLEVEIPDGFWREHAALPLL